MTRASKKVRGNFDRLSGSRAEVWHGSAYKTSGGLTKGDLLQNKSGRIVSRAKHSSAKRENRLVKAGYGTKKGTFGWVGVGNKTGKSSRGRRSRGRRSRKMKGGMYALSPSSYDGEGVSTGGNDVQFRAGMGN
jgi:hypothetical protein